MVGKELESTVSAPFVLNGDSILEGSQLESALVERAKTGDGKAFEAVFEPYRRNLERFATHLLSNPTDGEEVAQDTLAKAWEALPQITNELKVKPWLFKIATNECIDRARHRSVIRMVPLENLFVKDKDDEVIYSHPIIPGFLSTQSAEEEVIRIESEEATRMFVRGVLESLGSRHREALVYKYFLGLRYKEIAEILGTTVSAVKVILFRAKENFRREIRKNRKSANIGFLPKRA